MRKSRTPVAAMSGVLAYLLPAVAMGISEPRLVADLNITPSPRQGSQPAEFVRIGSQVLFTAQPGDRGRRLYRSDGTSEGTQELAMGCGQLEEGGFGLLFATATRAYYSLRCSPGVEALWTSDGTSSGTHLLLDAGSYRSPGPSFDAPQWVEGSSGVLFLQGGVYDSRLALWRTDGTVAGTLLLGLLSEGKRAVGAISRKGAHDFLLAVEEESAGLAIWKSDGTVAGTERVQVLALPDQHPRLASFESTAAGVAFMLSVWPPSRVELWYSDGTAEGTILGAELPFGTTEIPVAHDGSLYFLAEANGSEWIWRGDGSAATTRPIVPLGSRGATSRSFEFFRGQLYFIACAIDGESCELLRAPLEGGPAMTVADVCDATYCGWLGDELWVRGVGDRLAYTRKDDTAVEVWTSSADGGDASAVANLCVPDSCFEPYVGPVALDARIFFATVEDGGASRALWSSDGTPAGTRRHAGPLPVIGWFHAAGAPAPIVALPGGAGWLFAGGDTLHGLELWRAREQADAAVLVEDLRLDRPGIDDPEPIATIGSTFVFARMDDTGSKRTIYRHELGSYGVEPFLTVPVVRGRHGSRNRAPSLRLAGSAWFFIEGDLGTESPFALQVWRYDPESRDLRTLFPGDPRTTGIGALADDLVPSGADFLFLGSTDPALTPAIYRVRPLSGAISKLMDLPATWVTSIGQSGDRWFLIEDGQRVVSIDLARRTRELLGDFPDSHVSEAVALGEGVLFTVEWDYYSSAVPRTELWQSDGTITATREIAEWPQTQSSCDPRPSLPARGSASPALFSVQSYCDPESSELWITDGSAERTGLLRRFPEDRLAIAEGSTLLAGNLQFLVSHFDAETGTSRGAIWKTDGTAAGTTSVAELPARDGSPESDWLELARGAEAIYFPWSDEEHGHELWRTDGTAGGTGLVADLEPAPGSSWPRQLRTVGDQVIFSAWTAAAGFELWQVDGASLSPELVADLFPGIESSAPLVLGATDEALFFLADDGVVGREIWEISRPSVAPCTADATTLCLAGDRFRARAVRRDFAGKLGAAAAVPLTGESGYFWFFAPGNPEVLLKIVDACGLPGFENFWAYSSGLTNVEVDLEIVDTVSGERTRIRTRLGEAYGPLFDSGSFQVCAAAAPTTAAPAALPPTAGSSTVLPLLDGRFEARASWQKRDGTTGVANAVQLAADSGYFWFFSPESVEVLIKMVDACGFEGFDNFWVFAGGLTDVEVHLEVTDTWSGEVVRHDNVQGNPFHPLLETGRLRVCE